MKKILVLLLVVLVSCKTEKSAKQPYECREDVFAWSEARHAYYCDSLIFSDAIKKGRYFLIDTSLISEMMSQKKDWLEMLRENAYGPKK